MTQENPTDPQWDDRPPRQQRSLFWPVLLIGVGIVLLLSQLGVIAAISWGLLLRFWPVLLIIAGLDLLLGRRAPILGTLLGILVLALVLGLLAFGPAAGWLNLQRSDWDLPSLNVLTEVRHSRLEEPIDGARDARVTLDLGMYRTEVDASADDDLLLEAEVDYFGQMRFDVIGKATRTILLDEVATGINWSSVTGDHRWDIGLSPEVPMELTVDVGSGPVELNLERLNLTELALDGGSGSIAASLPFGDYNVSADLGSGSASIDLPEGSDVVMRLETGSGMVDLRVGDAADLNLTAVDLGSGSFTVRIPEDSGVRLRVRDDGSGAVVVPSEMDKVKGSAKSKEGTWETDRFDRADHQVIIDVYDMGSGSLRIQFD